MRTMLAIVLFCATVLVGCGPKSALPPSLAAAKTGAAAPVEETPEQIATKLRTPMAPLKAALIAPQDMAVEVKTKMLADVRAVMTTSSATENGKQAIAQVAGEMEEIIRKGRDAKKWSTAMTAVELYEVLVPGSTKYAKIKEQCDVYLKMPKVSIKGFFNVDTRKDEIYVFLEVQTPDGKKKDVKVEPGEEFEGFRLARIIGNQQGVELEYLKLPGEFIQIKK